MCSDIPFFRRGDYNEVVKGRFANMDFRKLARDVGADVETEGADFTHALQRVLDRFLSDQYTPNVPKRNVVISEFLRIQKPARALLDALTEIDHDQNFTLWAMQTGYEGSFPFEGDETGQDAPDVGLTPFECEQEQLRLLLGRLLHVTDTMLADTSPNGAKGKKDIATHKLVHGLAGIYTHFAGVSPRVGFSKNVAAKEYDGPFFLFVEACLLAFAPELYRGNSSLGNIITRAFKEHPH